MSSNSTQKPQGKARTHRSQGLFWTLLSVVTSLFIVISLIGCGIFICCTNMSSEILSKNFSQWEGSGFTQEQIVEAALATKDYTVVDNNEEKLMDELRRITGLEDPSRLLDGEVLSHLDDVYYVVDGGRGVIIGLMIASFVLCVFLALSGKKQLLGATLRRAGGSVFGIFVALALWCLIDFNGFFTLLHSLFFADGTWLFDAKSLLIRMYPTQFWIGMGVVWLCTSLICSVLCFILGTLLKRKKRL